MVSWSCGHLFMFIASIFYVNNLIGYGCPIAIVALGEPICIGIGVIEVRSHSSSSPPSPPLPSPALKRVRYPLTAS